MCLNSSEHLKVRKFVESLSDSDMKTALKQMYSEYMEYSLLGTPKDCKNFKECCDLGTVNYIIKKEKECNCLKDKVVSLNRELASMITEINSRKKGYHKKRNSLIGGGSDAIANS